MGRTWWIGQRILGVIYRLGGLRQGHMSTQRSVGIWSHVIRECHSTERWLTAHSAKLCFFGHKHYLVLALYSLFEYRRRKSLFCRKSRNPSDLHCLSTVCPSPAMFPQHFYTTLLRVSAVMRKKVDPASYGWSGRICHCSSPTDWISIKSLHMKKNIWLWALRHCVNDWSAFWILTGHRVMLCSHWLMLTLSSRVVHFLSTISQPQ